MFRRHSPILGLLAALLLLLAACSDGDDESSAEDETTTTTEATEVFDPDDFTDGGGDADDDGDDDATATTVPEGEPHELDETCTPAPEEDNEATIVREYLECALPGPGDDVSGANFEFGADGNRVFVSGPIDEGDAVALCEATSTILSEGLGIEDLEVTVTGESDVLSSDEAAPLAVGSTPGTCELA